MNYLLNLTKSMINDIQFKMKFMEGENWKSNKQFKIKTKLT